VAVAVAHLASTATSLLVAVLVGLVLVVLVVHLLLMY
jgi:hypothetical protein